MERLFSFEFAMAEQFCSMAIYCEFLRLHHHHWSKDNKFPVDSNGAVSVYSNW